MAVALPEHAFLQMEDAFDLASNVSGQNASKLYAMREGNEGNLWMFLASLAALDSMLQ